MCGIAGIWNLGGDKASIWELRRMLSVQKHRGPEGAAFTYMNESSILLGFLQLGFTDNQSGMQPLFNEDGSIALVYNGEIYDYELIREDLISRGHHLSTKSDSEVLIHLYEEYGEEFIQKLNGEFAFALYDDNKKQLLLARDPFGINPLAFTFDRDVFYFSSEAKGILATQKIERALNPDYIASVAIGIPNTRPTFFKHIENLRPGHCMIINGSGYNTYRYWKPSFNKIDDDFQTAKIKIRSLIENAVARRVKGEVPMALALSSGLDSTIIAGLVKKLGHDKPVYSVGFPGYSFDESHIAESTSKHYGLIFKSVNSSMADLAKEFKKTLWHAENSTNSLSNAARFLMHKAIRSDALKAVMGGEASDEIFGGYPYFILEAIWRKGLEGDSILSRSLFKRFKVIEQQSHKIFWSQPRNLKARISPYNSPVFALLRAQNAAKLPRWLWSEEIRQQLSAISAEELFLEELPPELYRNLSGFDTTRMVSRSIASTFVFTGLGDRLEMGNSLEGRVPFLDRDVINYAYSLPEKYFLDLLNLKGKYILREAFKDLLPPDFQPPQKHIFMSPTFSALFKTPAGKELYNQYLSPGELKKSGIINPSLMKLLKTLWRVMPNSSANYLFVDSIIGLALSLQILNDIFMVQDSSGISNDKSLEITEHFHLFYARDMGLKKIAE
jgi:asparagine synthase (glutamine-hydrolysing)